MKRLTVLLLLALSVAGSAQDIARKADSLLGAYTKRNQFSGNVLISKKGKIIFEKAYGYADKETNRLNTLQTEFRAGSLTKMFTSTLILQLVEKGKLSLEDPVGKYVPSLEGGANITIRNLLGHTSGLRGTTPPNAANAAALIKGYKSAPMAFVPGQRFEYNNFNFILLGYIAEKITSKPYADLVRENILLKAGMTHSGIDYRNRKSADMALGYMIDEKTGQLARMETQNIDAAEGAGALYTTVGDLLNWSKAIDDHKLLSATSFEMAQTPAMPGYGLGWTIRNYGNHVKVGHTGSIEGFMSEFMKFRDDDITIIFLSNLLPPEDIHLERSLGAIAFGEPFKIETEAAEITLPAELLPKYVGTYEAEGQEMVVSIKEGKLYVLAPGGDTAELVPQGANRFFVKGPKIGVEFLEENGRVQAMNLDMRGGQKFKKLH